MAKGFEALIRISRKLQPPSADAHSTLKRFVTPDAGEATGGARVRRLALEALITGSIADDEIISVAVKIRMRKSTRSPFAAKPAALLAAARDESPIVAH